MSTTVTKTNTINKEVSITKFLALCLTSISLLSFSSPTPAQTLPYWHPVNPLRPLYYPKTQSNEAIVEAPAFAKKHYTPAVENKDKRAGHAEVYKPAKIDVFKNKVSKDCEIVEFIINGQYHKVTKCNGHSQ